MFENVHMYHIDIKRIKSCHIGVNEYAKRCLSVMVGVINTEGI